ncbi:hypothetical protein GJ744_004210 [Endocarpon pusillum]|uniref:Xylanolytic transcriptional activator regulatory domain-containing protein n=1 Tax=Endocarpon pusillum TaxID=364733 RepID=A0A8H7A8R2_9EURO|nr:hypothetical protein GJ744_004210 [Endocarpon pusillum]
MDASRATWPAFMLMGMSASFQPSGVQLTPTINREHRDAIRKLVVSVNSNHNIITGRRKSSAPTTELIAASVAEELKLNTVSCPENVPPSTRSVCFSEPPNDIHQDPHPSGNPATDPSRVEYVSDESGTSWHVLERATSHGSRPDVSSQSSGPALADFGYAESAVGLSKKILELRNSHTSVRATYAIPGGESFVQHNQPLNPPCLVPVRDLIGFDLPDAQICDVLVETYFFAVHWFSLVIYEPKFRAQYQRIITTGYASRSEYGFLLLLLMVLSLGCWYGPMPGQNTSDGTAELGRMHEMFLKKVREQFMDIMDEDSLEYVQLCTLLGSFYLYHGRPRSSFSILGAATKSAQAMGLHRDSGSKFPEDITEERKRLWWTIYTWDRFATIVYGRPLSINDQDCNVLQPAEVIENIHFDRTLGPERICLSIYQAQLNEVYKIASPIIENIYGIRTSTDLRIRSMLPEMITQASHQMREWQNNLPPYLALDKMNDISSSCSTSEKMHRLQALSLQLTYDNLMIIIHRPLLADQRASLTKFRERAQSQARPSEVPPELHFPTSNEDSNFKECLDSALRVSRVQNKPELMKLAAETHLVAFLGMNLFTSSVVMSVCALSDPLSDTAQEAKRGITRTLLVQKSLSRRTSLSMQSSVILEDIVQLILEREREEMLRSAQSGLIHPQLNALQQQHDQSLQGSPTSVYGGDMGTSPGPYHPQMVAGNGINVDSGDQVLNNSLISLQRIIQESSYSRQQRPTEYYYRHNNSIMAPDMGCDTGSNVSEDAMRSNDIDTSWMEDLGQTWLWNMEPFS